MPFAFIASHFWGGWLAIGAILLHIAVKLPIIRVGLSRQSRPGTGAGGWALLRWHRRPPVEPEVDA